MTRCFIGIVIPEGLKSKIVSIQGQLKRLPIDCKMTERENLHISLSFLGEVDGNKINDISKKLDEICSRYQSFEASVSTIKFIPNENFIRVLALDVSGSTLKMLGRDIEHEIGGDAKPPHLTLCRVKNIKDKQKTVEDIKSIDSNVGSFKVSSVCLIQSVLQKPGPIYTVLHESKLS